MSYKSIIFWPEESVVHVTSDTHRDEKGAEYVCNTIKELGMGCDGEIFPTETLVLPAIESVVTVVKDTLPADELPEFLADALYDQAIEDDTILCHDGFAHVSVNMRGDNREVTILRQLLPREVVLRNNLTLTYDV